MYTSVQQSTIGQLMTHEYIILFFYVQIQLFCQFSASREMIYFHYSTFELNCLVFFFYLLSILKKLHFYCLLISLGIADVIRR